MTNRSIVAIIFITALLSGLFWSGGMFGENIGSGGDELQYSVFAKSILGISSGLSHEVEEWWFTSEPFYPFFVAGIYYFFGVDNFDAVRIVQIFIFSLTIVLIYFLALKIFNRKTAFFSGIALALCYPLAAMAGFLYREVFFTFLFVLSAVLFYLSVSRAKAFYYAFCGLILGVGALTNGVIQFLPFVLFVFVIFYYGKDFLKNKMWLKASLMPVFFFLVFGAWSLFGYGKGAVDSINAKAGGALSRRAEMIETITGDRYFRHLAGQLFGYYFFEKDGFNPHEFLGHPKTSIKVENMLSEGKSIKEINSVLAEENSKIIFGNLPRYFAISILDFLQFNGPMLPSPQNYIPMPAQNLFIAGSHPGLPVWFKVAVLIGLRLAYWFFFGFVIYGLAKAFKDWRKYGFLIIYILYFNGVYAALFGVPRYSISLYPFYIMVFVYGFFVMLDKLRFKWAISVNQWLDDKLNARIMNNESWK